MNKLELEVAILILKKDIEKALDNFYKSALKDDTLIEQKR